MDNKMIYKTPYGEYEITGIEINKYQYGNGLYLGLLYFDPDCEAEMPFATLTVNLDGYVLTKDNVAFVDTNNLRNAEEFIKEYGLGRFTGNYGASGFVTNYPLYEFDLDRIRELSK